MAECSYARCVQQRRNIRRELQRWTKNMVHIVGLERIAEELMGRRKWKLYQESMSRSYLQPLNNNIKQTRTNQEEYYKDQQPQIIENTETNQNGEEKNPRLGDIQKDIIKTQLIKEENGVKADEKQKENESGGKQEVDDRLKDWTPQTKCYFCVDGKLDSEHTAHGVLSPRHTDSDSTDSHSDNEVPPSLTPSTPSLLNNNNNNHLHHRPHHHHHHRGTTQHPVAPANMTTIESVTSMAALAAVAALSGGSSPGAPAPHLPFYTHSMLPQHWYLANVARSFQEQRLAAAATDVDKNSGGEQPLDLSKGASNSALDKNTTNNQRLPTLDTKHIFKAKPRMSAVAGRRTYTEDELQAALRDIQSGKLGTRRAAVIYGIPRSTLRNKVYKLALERERESHLNNTPLKLEEEEVMDDDKELSGAEEEKEVEKALQAPLLCMEDILRFSGMDTPPEALKNLLQRAKEGQEVFAGLEHSEVGPYIQSLLLASQNILTQSKPLDSEFLKRMTEDKQQNNGDSDKIPRPSPSNSVVGKLDKGKSESDMETDESPSNVILKIPSFKPTSSKNGCELFRSSVETSSIVSPPVTSESSSPPILPGKGMTIKDVKDVIAQSISQKFQQNLEPSSTRRPIIDMDYKRGAFTPPLSSSISVIKTQQDLNRPYQPQQKSQQNTSGGSGGKGTRPKRGKYRNYDRDSLVEAVRAVQRGEMSVHRAGSYYGVPHSTLEYKVKERHLMRPRKRDPKPNPVDEKIASLKQNDIRNTQIDNKLKQPTVMKPPPQKFPPTSPNGMKLPIFETGITPPLAPFPFWPHPSFHHIPIDYARNPTTAPFPPNPEFFASQMMQKLQEESTRTTIGATNQQNPTLAKSARQIAESLLDGTGSNGSFLDGIIRSSLESGVAAPEEKSPKEDKNVAPENMSNKALLDQLCRNSRLTPLSKPAMDPNSSGDEYYRKGSSPLNFAGASSSSRDGQMDTSPPPIRYENSELHTIELSNDSNESNDSKQSKDQQYEQQQQTTPPPRIYLKKDLANPDNLQPEMLMRFLPDMERNGINDNSTTTTSTVTAAAAASAGVATIITTGSASDNDAPQD